MVNYGSKIVSSRGQNLQPTFGTSLSLKINSKCQHPLRGWRKNFPVKVVPTIKEGTNLKNKDQKFLEKHDF